MTEQTILTILSTLSQVIGTIIGLYLATLIFAISHFYKHDFERKRNTNTQRIKVIKAIIVSVVSLLIIGLLFLYPSTENGPLGYLMIMLLIVFWGANAIVFNLVKDYYSLEKSIILFCGISALISVILGFYIIMHSISAFTIVDYIPMSYLYDLIKLSRLFILVTVLSISYLISFILVHKFLIVKE